MPSHIPPYELELAPGARASDANPSFSDITVGADGLYRLMHFQYRRGMDSDIGVIQPGSGSLDLLNNDRALDPSYTAGPFYGRPLTNAHVRLRATISGTVYDMFRGNVQEGELAWEGPRVGKVSISLVDRQSAFKDATISGQRFEELTGARILWGLEAAGVPTHAAQQATGGGWRLGTSRLGVDTYLAASPPLTARIDAGQSYVIEETLDAVKALEYLGLVAQSDPGLLFWDGAGNPVFRDRSHLTPVPDAAVLTLTDDASLADASHIVYSALRPYVGKQSIRNDVTVKAGDDSAWQLSDSESIDLFDQQAVEIPTKLRGWGPDALQLAGWYLKAGKDEKLRIRGVRIPGGSLLQLAAILSLEPGDRVIVQKTPRTWAPVETLEQDSIVEGLSVEGTPSLWSAELQLSPLITVQGGGFKLGTSRLGRDARLVYG